MKSIVRSTLTAVLILTALFACAKKDTGGGTLRSSGDISVNGPGFNGSVHGGTKVLYTLKDIHENQNYTLRTEIGLKSDGSSTSPDGTLTVNIYTSADAFRNDPTLPVRSAVALPAPNSNIYEVFFPAPSSGDFVVVISGVSDSVPGIQFFYNLSLMSAGAIAGVLTPITSETGTVYQVQQTTLLNPGFLDIYNGGVASLGTSTIAIDLVSGTINLDSSATTTIANPQIFVYLDSSLTISSLMLSSIPTTTEFVITTFNAGVPTSIKEQPDTGLISSVPISNVTFTDGSPFIVVKGFISAVTYTLSVGP